MVHVYDSDVALTSQFVAATPSVAAKIVGVPLPVIVIVAAQVVETVLRLPPLANAWTPETALQSSKNEIVKSQVPPMITIVPLHPEIPVTLAASVSLLC